LLISAGREERPVVVALEPVASLSMGAAGVIEMYRLDVSGAKPVCIEQKMVSSRLVGTLEIVRNIPSFPRSRLKLSQTYSLKLRSRCRDTVTMLASIS
jgi:hypothetical protein